MWISPYCLNNVSKLGNIGEKHLNYLRGCYCPRPPKTKITNVRNRETLFMEILIQVIGHLNDPAMQILQTYVYLRYTGY